MLTVLANDKIADSFGAALNRKTLWILENALCIVSNSHIELVKLSSWSNFGIRLHFNTGYHISNS